MIGGGLCCRLTDFAHAQEMVIRYEFHTATPLTHFGEIWVEELCFRRAESDLNACALAAQKTDRGGGRLWLTCPPRSISEHTEWSKSLGPSHTLSEIF